jgi:hypothetical protein
MADELEALRLKNLELFTRGISMDTAIEAPDFTRWPLKQALYRRNLKQAHIAKALGKDPAWVSRLVRGWIEPTDVDTERIAQATGISVDELKPLLKPTGQA